MSAFCDSFAPDAAVISFAQAKTEYVCPGYPADPSPGATTYYAPLISFSGDPRISETQFDQFWDPERGEPWTSAGPYICEEGGKMCGAYATNNCQGIEQATIKGSQGLLSKTYMNGQGAQIQVSHTSIGASP